MVVGSHAIHAAFAAVGAAFASLFSNQAAAHRGNAGLQTAAAAATTAASWSAVWLRLVCHSLIRLLVARLGVGLWWVALLWVALWWVALRRRAISLLGGLRGATITSLRRRRVVLRVLLRSPLVVLLCRHFRLCSYRPLSYELETGGLVCVVV